MEIKEAIKKVIAREDLTADEMADVMNEIMSGTTTSAQKGGFLVGLKAKGETPEEPRPQGTSPRRIHYFARKMIVLNPQKRLTPQSVSSFFAA